MQLLEDTGFCIIFCAFSMELRHLLRMHLETTHSRGNLGEGMAPSGSQRAPGAMAAAGTRPRTALEEWPRYVGSRTQECFSRGSSGSAN